MTQPDDAQLVIPFDREVGTVFDWADWPPGLWEDEKGRIVQYNERVFVSAVAEMLRVDGTAQSIETALTMPLRQANTTIVAPDKDRGQTEFVREALECAYVDGGMETDLDAVIAQMTYAVASRKTYHEKVFTKNKDGRVVYKRLAWRPPSSCELIRTRDHGLLAGFRQFQDWQTGNPDPNGYVEIPKQRALVYIHGQDRDPLYGKSDMDVTYWCYQLKQKLLFLWSTFCGNQSLPKVVAYGKDPKEAEKNARMLAGLRSSGVLGMSRTNPEEKLWEILDTAGQGAGAFRDMVSYLDGQCSRSVMAGWLDLTTSASEGHGSYALSSDQSGIFLASRYAVAKEIAKEFTAQVIAPLVWLNFGPDAKVPKLVFEKISTDQAAKAMQMLQQLGAAQNMNVPAGFIDLLMERVAQYLDLDDEKLAKVIEQRQEQARLAAEQLGRSPEDSATPVGQLSDKVQAILDTVQQPGTVPTVATPQQTGG